MSRQNKLEIKKASLTSSVAAKKILHLITGIMKYFG
jgi:hypothetical protein